MPPRSVRGAGKKWGVVTAISFGRERGSDATGSGRVTSRRFGGMSALGGRVSGAHLVVLVAGLFGALLTMAAVRNADHTVAVAGLRHDVRIGAEVRADDLVAVQMHTDSDTLAGLVSMRDASRYINQIAVAPMQRGDVLRRSDLRSAADTHRQRSISFSMEAADAVGGDLSAGDRIDVIGVTHDGVRSGYVVLDAALLAVSNPQSSGPLRSSDHHVTLTISVESDAALRLVAAQTGGKVVVVKATGATPAHDLVPFSLATATSAQTNGPGASDPQPTITTSGSGASRG